MNLTSNPATIAYLCLEIDIKLILRFKIENIQHGVFRKKLAVSIFCCAALSVSADFVLRTSFIKKSSANSLSRRKIVIKR